MTLTFSRTRSRRKLRTAVISGLELPNLLFPVLIESKSPYGTLWVINNTHPHPLPIDETVQATLYSITLSMSKKFRLATFLFPASSNIQTYDTQGDVQCSETPSFPSFSWEVTFTRRASSHKPLLCGTDSQEDTSSTLIVTCSNLGLSVIIPTYLRLLFLTFIAHTTNFFINSLLVALWSDVGWTLVKNIDWSIHWISIKWKVNF